MTLFIQNSIDDHTIKTEIRLVIVRIGKGLTTKEELAENTTTLFAIMFRNYNTVKIQTL